MPNRPKSDQDKLFARQHDDLVNYLSKSVTDYELVRLLEQVFSKRVKTIGDENSAYYDRSRFVLAQQSHFGDPDELESEILFIAPQDTEESTAEYDRNIGLQQEGKCLNCGASILSYAKFVICPICESKVGCT